MPRLTVDEYLALERAGEFRHEYYAGEVFAMAGASYRHGKITGNTSAALHAAMSPNGCDVITSDLRVSTGANGLYTYPDVVVVCGKPRFLDGEMDTLLNPLILVEVLSPSTKDYDRGSKFEMYRTIASLVDYLVIAQDRPHVEHHARQAGARWVLSDVSTLDGVVNLTAVELSLPLAAIYQGVAFDQAAS
jgi:Uma2 family endonuclease